MKRIYTKKIIWILHNLFQWLKSIAFWLRNKFSILIWDQKYESTTETSHKKAVITQDKFVSGHHNISFVSNSKQVTSTNKATINRYTYVWRNDATEFLYKRPSMSECQRSNKATYWISIFIFLFLPVIFLFRNYIKPSFFKVNLGFLIKFSGDSCRNKLRLS